MTIINIAIFKINSQTGELTQVDLIHPTDDFQQYYRGLIKTVIESTNGRKFKLRSPSTEVYSSVRNAIYHSRFRESVQVIANRLLLHETQAQERMAHLEVETQKGILLQAHVIDHNVHKYVLCKTEDTEVIEEIFYHKIRGYPVKRKIYKSCNIVFDEDTDPSLFMVYDTNQSIAKYWVEGFLEIDALWDNEYNTDKAFSAVDKVLTRIKATHKSDHTLLRNMTIGAFRTTTEFSIDNYLDALKTYQPVDSNLSIQELINKVSDLPERYNFDRRFTPVAPVIGARMRSTYHLSDQIDLQIKGEIDIRNTIFPIQDPDGKKYLKIRTDEGYEAFRR